MKIFIVFFLLCSRNFALAQLSDNFTDGDFTNNPVWTGSNNSNDFTIIAANQLRSASTAANSNMYLSTANSLATNCTWEFWCNLKFSTSGLNYADVYLISDQTDLQSANINGYFVRIGNTEDEISLYKRTGAKSTSVKIIDGINGSVGSSNNTVKIKVSRSSANLFTLERDVTGTGTSYFKEGNITDAQITASAHFGIFIQQSSATFHQKHFFDDFKITPLITDNIPPQLVSAKAVDSVTVEVTFNEPVDSTSAKTSSNYTLSDLGNPASVIMVNASTYRLHYTTGLQTNTYTLTVLNVKDLNENIISSNNSGQFNFVKLYIAQKNDVAINEIFADPVPQIDLPALEFIELWNTTNKTIGIKDWKYSDITTSFTFGNDSIRPDEYVILCARADTLEFKRFGRVIGISPWPSLNNSGDSIKLVSDKNVIINQITYSDAWYKDAGRKQGGWSLERIDPLSKCEGQFNWMASTDISGGTPGRSNSVYQLNYDLIPLKADSIKRNSDTTIQVYFNKPLDQSTVTLDKLIISPVFAPVKTIHLNAEAKQATVTYPQKFTPGTKFALTIQSVKDCSGNTITGINQPFEFTTDQLPPVRMDTARVFITEFFPDPSPEVSLPLAEFVEIYNAGSDTIDLEGWSLNDPATKAVINKTSILPKQYLILCPAADTTQYKIFGNVAGLSPWPSLNNASDQIILKSFTNRTIDSLSYKDTWYKDALKKSGGWSLERIDPLSTCNSTAAWGASKDSTGGTPGKVNSVYHADYDLLAVHADSLKKMSDSTVTVYFNKNLNQASVTADKFILSPSSGSIKSTALNTALNQVSLTFSQNFSPETVYSLSVQLIEDCGGSHVSNLNQPLQFSIPALPVPPPARADTAKIFITEIFADPSPEVGLPLVEFVEIYNPGTDTINLDGWSLNDPSSKAVIGKNSVLPKQYLILCPAADTTQYRAFGPVAGLSPWPSLNNSSDQLVLKSFNDRTVDSVTYSDDWYKDAVKKQGGWSLERIDPLSKCEGAFNWETSKDVTGGTPGKVNSVYQKDFDLRSLSADSLIQLTDTTIKIYFNKPLDQSTATSDKFSISPAFAVLKTITSDTGARQFTLTYPQKFTAATEFSLTIQSLNDCSGNGIGNTNQPLKFSTPALPPLPPVRLDTAKMYITEIFADPSPEVGLPLVEFVEIYNPGTDTINLDGWSLNDPSSKAAIGKNSVLPKQYLILCPAADTTQYRAFGPVAGLSPWPSLNNSSDQLVLKSFNDRTVDSVTYSDAWYKDAVKKQGGWSLERIDQVCNGWYSWAASSDVSGGTPGKINSNTNPDNRNIALRIDSLQVTSDSTLRIHFNIIQDTTFLKPINFKLNGVAALSVKASENFRSINLKFKDHFTEGTTYTLIAEALRTCSGLLIAQPNNQKAFTIPAVPELNYPIVINEIFAAPSPVSDMPEAEFVELFNPTDKTVFLKGLIYEDPLTQYIFPSGSIEPGGYLILCSAKDTLKYKPFGNVYGLTIWPNLNNDKDLLILRNNKGNEIYRTSYESGWHRDKDKQSGGWSLELIDPDATCSGKQNWTSSNNLSGGTPGKQNSVYKTNTRNDPLKLLSGILTDSVTLQLTFSKTVDSLSAARINGYMVNNGIGKPVQATVLAPDFTQIILKFQNPLTRGNIYKISLTDITDCSGSIISAMNNSAEFFFAKRIEGGDILINEILFNPRKNGADFVEIYNNSTHDFDLRDLAIATVRDSLTSIKPLRLITQLIRPGEYLVLTTDPDNIKKEYFIEKPDAFLKMQSMPAFNDESGEVVLLSHGIRIDHLAYTDKMHFKLIKDPEGVSLERSSFNKATNEPDNFRSAAASAGYATPGYKNSQFLEDVTSEEEVFLSSKTFSPDNDGFEDVMILNCKFTDPGWVANITIYNDKGALIKKLTKNLSLAADNTIYWDGLNEFNEKVPVGIYVLYMEIFNLQGKVKQYRRSFVRAAKLN